MALTQINTGIISAVFVHRIENLGAEKIMFVLQEATTEAMLR